MIDFNVATHCSNDGEFKVLNPENKKIGTLSYMAPEMLQGQDHTVAVDYWSAGVVLYQLSHGSLPWKAPKEEKHRSKEMLSLIENHPIEGRFKVGSPAFQELLKGLLDPNPATRWNADRCQKSELMAGINWADVRQRRRNGEFIPGAKTFDESLAVNESLGPRAKPPPVSADGQKRFEDWDWTAK